MEYNGSGCLNNVAAVLVVIVIGAAMFGALVTSRMLHDGQQAKAAIAQAESEARQVESREETARLQARLQADADARRDFYVTMASLRDTNAGLIVALSALMGAMCGAIAVLWLERKVGSL